VEEGEELELCNLCQRMERRCASALVKYDEAGLRYGVSNNELAQVLRWLEEWHTVRCSLKPNADMPHSSSESRACFLLFPANILITPSNCPVGKAFFSLCSVLGVEVWSVYCCVLGSGL